MTRRLHFRGAVPRGTVRLPGDKSIAHRTLLVGALSTRGLRIRNLPAGADVAVTRAALAALGVRMCEEGGGIRVEGSGGRLSAPAAPLDCGNAGTAMRLLAGVLAGQPFESVLVGDASLSRRPMGRVAEPLQRMGAEVVTAPGGGAPLVIRGRRPLAPIDLRLAVPSAQVKSALILAALFADGESRIVDPFGTRDHTERMLAALAPGRLLVSRTGDGGTSVAVRPGPLPAGGTLEIPGDPSSAAFFLAAAAIVPGGRVAARGIAAGVGRTGFLDVLAEMGARVSVHPRAPRAGEPVADVEVVEAPLRGVRIAADRAPRLIDEIPVLAAVATRAVGRTRFEGLAELRLKESDRLWGVAAGLSAMGARVSVDGDALVVEGPARLRGAAVDTQGDHRLAMAFAVASLAVPRGGGETVLSDAGCVRISYPRFFEDLEALVEAS